MNSMPSLNGTRPCMPTTAGTPIAASRGASALISNSWSSDRSAWVPAPSHASSTMSLGKVGRAEIRSTKAVPSTRSTLPSSFSRKRYDAPVFASNRPWQTR